MLVDESRAVETRDALRSLLVSALADADAAWSLGGFGALAEFRRDPDEPVRPLDDGRIGLTTPRGGLGFDPDAAIVPVAYETPLPGGWSHALALCLPVAGAAEGGSRLTECGTDRAALRPGDAAARLFDLGLALPQGMIGLRTADRPAIAALRKACGRGSFAPDSPVPSLLAAGILDFVVATPLGRMEVFGRTGPPGAGAPRGFVVPQILRLGRLHAATAPIPAGLMPCAHLHPPHPCRDRHGATIPFRPERHAAFQALHARWGDPGHVALKRRIWAGEPAGSMAADRPSRAVSRVARMQAACIMDHTAQDLTCAAAGRGKSSGDTPR